MSGISPNTRASRSRFDSEPTLVVQLDGVIHQLIEDCSNVRADDPRGAPQTRAEPQPVSAAAPMRPSASRIDSADTHLLVAEKLLEQGDARGAVLQAQKALRLGRLRPKQQALYAWLLYQRSGAGAYVPPCVWQHLATALANDPHCERAHYYRGMLLKRRGELELARRHLARALQLNPDNAEAECELILLDVRRGAARR